MLPEVSATGWSEWGRGVPLEQNEPLRHPQISEFFLGREGDIYVARDRDLN